MVLFSVLSTTYAAAANLGGLTDRRVAAGARTIGECDTAFTVTYITVGGNVTQANVGGIADACEGGDVKATIVNSTGVSIGQGGPTAIPVDGDALDASASVSIAAAPDGELVTGVRVLIVGP